MRLPVRLIDKVYLHQSSDAEVPFTSDDHLVLRFSSQRDRQEIAICENQRKRVQSPPRRGRRCRLRTASIRSPAASYAQSLDAKRLLTHIQHVRRPTWCFVGGEARCGYPPGYIRRGRAVHSGYAPGMPVPQEGNGSRVAGPSGGDIVIRYIAGAHL